MGTIIHDLVAWTFSEEHLDEVTNHFKKELGDSDLFLISPIVTNGYVTMVMIPDGSKEGWATSRRLEIVRQYAKDWFKEKKIYASMIHVRYGECEPHLQE